jgi:hypothetical protein
LKFSFSHKYQNHRQNIEMKKIIAIILLNIPLSVIANDQAGNTYNPNSYGAPQLYYSAESIRERQEQELLKESNRIAKERLEVDQQRIQENKLENEISGE